MTNSGMLSVSGAASVTIQTFSNSGNVQVSNGASLSAATSEGDHYQVGQFTSTGTIAIGSGSTLTLEDGSSQLGTVSFADGTGTLVLTDLGYTQIIHGFSQGGSSGTLNLFQSGDVLDLGADLQNPFLPFLVLRVYPRSHCVLAELSHHQPD